MRFKYCDFGHILSRVNDRPIRISNSAAKDCEAMMIYIATRKNFFKTTLLFKASIQIALQGLLCTLDSDVALLSPSQFFLVATHSYSHLSLTHSLISSSSFPLRTSFSSSRTWTLIVG
jgi:hypothetical protein